jgi:signal recognition particle subunit SRP19
MRQQDKIIIWPTYFDSTKTRAEGRRVPKSLAISLPKINELKDATEKLHLEHEIVADRAHPKSPWAKTGMLLVKKKGPKEAIISNIAKQLVKTRSTVTAATTKEKKTD